MLVQGLDHRQFFANTSRIDMLTAIGLDERIGHECIYPTVEAAIDAGSQRV